MSRARTTPQMSRCTHGFRLQITLLNLSHRVPTPSVEPGTLPMDLLLQLENTYGPANPRKPPPPVNLLHSARVQTRAQSYVHFTKSHLPSVPPPPATMPIHPALPSPSIARLERVGGIRALELPGSWPVTPLSFARTYWLSASSSHL